MEQTDEIKTKQNVTNEHERQLLQINIKDGA